MELQFRAVGLKNYVQVLSGTIFNNSHLLFNFFIGKNKKLILSLVVIEIILIEFILESNSEQELSLSWENVDFETQQSPKRRTKPIINNAMSYSWMIRISNAIENICSNLKFRAHHCPFSHFVLSLLVYLLSSHTNKHSNRFKIVQHFDCISVLCDQAST